MDYCFYTKPILRLPEVLHQELLAFTDACEMNVNSYFTPGRHPGHSSSSFRRGKGTPEVLLRLFDLLDPLLPSTEVTAYVVNKLDAGGEVKEHTDATGSSTSIGYECTRHNMVHVALADSTPQTEYRFRRDLQNSPVTERMNRGYCYLFNNYALHSVHNVGQGTRTNLVLYYRDEKWQLKAQMYKHLGIVSATY